MCYNCGCSMPQDNMGNLKNITDSMLQELAEKRGKMVDGLRQELYTYLATGQDNDQGFEDMFESAATTWKQSVEEAKRETQKLLGTQVNKSS